MVFETPIAKVRFRGCKRLVMIQFSIPTLKQGFKKNPVLTTNFKSFRCRDVYFLRADMKCETIGLKCTRSWSTRWLKVVEKKYSKVKILKHYINLFCVFINFSTFFLAPPLILIGRLGLVYLISCDQHVVWSNHLIREKPSL